MKEVEKDLSNFKYRKAKGLPIPTTFVFDTVTYLKKAIENEIFAQDAGLARRIAVGASSKILIGKSYDVVNGVQGFMNYLITEFSSLGNIIFVYHERDEKDKTTSTATLTTYTGKVTVDPQYLASTLTLFNDVFRIETSSVAKVTKYTVTCRANNEVNAATTLLIDAEEPPNIMDMIAKHRANKLKQLNANS